MIEDDFSDLDDWISHPNAPDGGAIASGGTVQFTVGGDFNSISMPNVLAVNAQFQTLVMKITAASDIANYAGGIFGNPSTGGRITLNVDAGSTFFDNYVVFGTDANPWVAGSLIEIRLVPGPPIQFEYYLNGNLMGSGPFDARPCVFISIRLDGDETTSFSDFSLEVFGP